MPRWTLTLLIAVLAAYRPAAADEFSNARNQFLAAYAAAQAAKSVPAPNDSEELRAYPLYPYLQAARLERTLAADDEIAAFLDAQGDVPVGYGLRRDWLEDLARRRHWETYLEQFKGEATTSVTLQCHALAARAALDRDAGLEQDIARQWLAPKSLPDDCNPAFDWLRSRGALTPDLVEQRARLALSAGEPQLARYLAKTLPERRYAPLLQWAALLERPERSIPELIAHPERPVEPEALLAGWTQYARSDPEAAAGQFGELISARSLDARASSPLALATALALAWSRKPGALDFFERVQVEDFDEVAHEWHVRAAIWSGDWVRAASAIAAMPEALRNQNRWRYWAARALEANGDAEAAAADYASVVPTDNWYAALSAARLGQRFTPTLQAIPLDERQIDGLAKMPGFIRTRELLASELPVLAAAEWRVAFEALAQPEQVQAVGLADRWGWHHQAIASAAQLSLFNDYPLLYPRPFDEEVHAAARITKLSPELVYAIIRQESLYRADAGSSAGALGLMQLLPSTARRAARRWGLKEPTRSDLLRPSVNVPIGAAELRSLLDRFDGQAVLATAAYNAGPGAARRWLPASGMDTDVWVENIPFNETRAYVQRVAWHSLVFDWLDGRKPQDVATLLKPLRVPPADAALEATGN